MPDASNLQTSFHGGEWSPAAQGRADDPGYKAALGVCQNGHPTEEGAWILRSGTKDLGYTRNGGPAKLYRFQSAATSPYQIEVSAGHFRFFFGDQLCMSSDTTMVAGVSASSPAVMTISDERAWDQPTSVVVSLAKDATLSADMLPGCAYILNRPLLITRISSTAFYLYDPITMAPIDGSVLSVPGGVLNVSSILDVLTPFNDGVWQNLRGVQDEKTMLLLAGISPKVLTLDDITTTGNFAGFSLDSVDFIDGPYLDPPTDGALITPSAQTGVVTLTVTYPLFVYASTYRRGDRVLYGGSVYRSLMDANTSNTPGTATQAWHLEATMAPCVSEIGFSQGDVGRLVRLFSEPALWDKTVSYLVGDKVKYGDGYYSCVKAGNNVEPDTDVTYWVLVTSAASWTWCQIVSILTDASVIAQVRGKDIMYDLACSAWRLGAYSDGTGWPTCGTYAQGRVWLSGAIDNRFDATMSNGFVDGALRFSPTGTGTWTPEDDVDDGTVSGNNALSFTLNASQVDPVLWMTSDHNGVIMGTHSGEWVIQASNLNEPITPTSIQAHKMTYYGSENVEPIRTGLTVVFVQRQGMNVLEMISDAYSGKYSATNMAEKAKHLTSVGIEELAYQQNPSPILWARRSDGVLLGCTYKRESPFGTQPASFIGWHVNPMGTDRDVVSLQVGTSADGDVDTVLLVTKDADGLYRVEAMQQDFSAGDALVNGWFLDGACEPIGAQEAYVGAIKGVKFFGLTPLAGKTVRATCGIDLGEVTIAADGTAFIPYTDVFSPAYLAQVTEDIS